jgi:hypothetical protein
LSCIAASSFRSAAAAEIGFRERLGRGGDGEDGGCGSVEIGDRRGETPSVSEAFPVAATGGG